MDKELEKLKVAYEREDNTTIQRYGMCFDYLRFCVHTLENAMGRILMSIGYPKYLNEYKLFLDIGCGDGETLRKWVKFGARPTNCYGIDVLESRVSFAKSLHPNMNIVLGNGKTLPYPDRMFDVVSIFVVLSNVETDEGRTQILSEAKRVLKPGGFIMIYEQNEKINGGRNRGISKDKLKEMSGIDWFFVDIIPNNCRHLSYENIFKLATKTKDFLCYVALAKKGAK